MLDADFIILAGGMGTRLKSLVGDRPKPMADIDGRPFLYYLMRYLEYSGAGNVVLCIGGGHSAISGYFGSSFGKLNIDYSVEESPLGTGGAVKKAMRMTESEDVFVLNGDTFLKLDYASMFERHKNSEALFTMALKRMFNFERYGTMDVADGTVSAFNEKKPAAEGFINTGVYLMNRNIDRFFPEEDTFSFEKDFMEKKYETLRIRPFFTDAYFIDIGVPGDYVRARKEIGGVFN